MCMWLDFHTADIASCKPSDVDLNHNEAMKFFLRAEKVQYRVIHDYNHASCYVEGTMLYQPKRYD